jgi:4-hydroxy-2-oxoheptanedioate aldolase
MNVLEKKMVEVLQDLKENHHVVGVKAEFEAEGTRMEESLRLKEVVTRAGLDLAIKIGGCEAISNMYAARVIGVNTIIAPMIESQFALQKFMTSLKLAFPEEERDQIKFLVNIETITGYNNLDHMLEIKEQLGDLTGVVLGRVDMTGSMGLTKEDINSPQIYDIAYNICAKAKQHNLEVVIGGGVSAQTLPFLRQLPAGSVDRYETRKVIFGCPGALDENADKGILKAVGFELMYLKNKRDYYGMIFAEDRVRIDMLQSRYDKLIKEAGGQYE